MLIKKYLRLNHIIQITATIMTLWGTTCIKLSSFGTKRKFFFENNIRKRINKNPKCSCMPINSIKRVSTFYILYYYQIILKNYIQFQRQDVIKINLLRY